MQKIFVLLIALGLAGLLFAATFLNPVETPPDLSIEYGGFYALTLPSRSTDVKFDFEKSRLALDQYSKVSTGSVVYSEFARLSSIFFRPIDPANYKKSFSFSGKTISLGDSPAIISLYDSFVTQYQIFSTSGNFRMEQITNGSTYIGKEDDGTMSIYAIDATMRVFFLDKDGKEMTDMLLLPGSYLRFDPAKNKELKGYDLFRFITSLDQEGGQAFEFINPRVRVGDEDIFFVYRLSQLNRNLFKAFYLFFQSKAANIDNISQYKNAVAVSDSSKDYSNPGKQNYQLLLRLSQQLARAVDPKATEQVIVPEVQKIYEQSKAIATANDINVTKLLEKFLSDGRFIIYSSSVGPNYEKIYTGIARVIKIFSDNGRIQLLQSLSDIYSRNLVDRKADNTGKSISTYGPTAESLYYTTTTPNNGLQSKDYFDLSIYAFNILNKVMERGVFISGYLENSYTYKFLNTFLISSLQYFDSLDGEKRTTAVKAFSSRFYDYVFSTYVRSLYFGYTESKDGKIFLKSNFSDAGTIKGISKGFIQDLRTFNNYSQKTLQVVETAYSGSQTALSTRIRKSIVRMNAFLQMIKDSDAYNSYLDQPYAVDDNDIQKLTALKTGEKDIDIFLPLFDETGRNLIRIEQHKDTTDVVVPKTEESNIVRKMAPFFPSIEINNVTKILEESVQFERIPYVIPFGSSTYDVEIDMLMTRDYKSLSKIRLVYKTLSIVYEADPMDIPQFLGDLGKIFPVYIAQIENLLNNGSTVQGDIILYPKLKKYRVNGNLYDL